MEMSWWCRQIRKCDGDDGERRERGRAGQQGRGGTSAPHSAVRDSFIQRRIITTTTKDLERQNEGYDSPPQDQCDISGSTDTFLYVGSRSIEGLMG